MILAPLVLTSQLILAKSQHQTWYGDKTIEVITTAYNSVEAQTDSTPCLSASGEDICREHEKGVKICAFNGYPFGTEIIVPGWGTCRVADRTSNKFTGRLDLYFGGVNQIHAAKQWGKRYKKITLINVKQ